MEECWWAAVGRSGIDGLLRFYLFYQEYGWGMIGIVQGGEDVKDVKLSVSLFFSDVWILSKTDS
jgi:hypothetical protein